MGCGKTTVGTLLARRLGRPFWDGDAHLEELTGMTAARLAAERGSTVLHRLEAEVLVRGVGQRPVAVVAAAAAAVLTPEIPALLSGAWTVWLRADPALLAARLARDGGHRPLPPGDLLGALREMARARDPVYARIADLSVEVARTPPAELVRSLVARMPADV